MKLTVTKTTIPATKLVQDAGLWEFTTGYHDGWEYYPNHMKGCRLYSDTPLMGLGNNFHDTEENFFAWMGQCIATMLNPEEIEPARCLLVDGDTCAFLRVNEDGSGTLYEIGFTD